MSSTGDRLEFAAQLTHSEAMVEDKNSVLAQQAEISMVMTDAIFVL
jgi:hypothetical protein